MNETIYKEDQPKNENNMNIYNFTLIEENGMQAYQ